MNIVARHLTIKGRVQGVYYRGWSVETANALGLTGWVRNRMNGDVEAVVQGGDEAVERMLVLVWRGPSAARVDAVDIEELAVSSYTDFKQNQTF